MSMPPRFKKGQNVIIKKPGPIEAIVLEPRPADAELPEIEKLYSVRIKVDDEPILCSSGSLEPKPPKELVHYSAEWWAELQRFLNAGQRWYADKNDLAARDQFCGSASRLGYYVR